MIFQQFYLNCLAHASHLAGDGETRAAAVVDPQRDIDIYEAFAREHGLRIAHAFLTHFHADFIAGHLELRERTGATIYLGPPPRRSTRSGPRRRDAIQFGKVRLQALETPGHTPESVCILVFVGQYATWAGTLLSRDKPIVLVSDPGSETAIRDSARAHRIRSCDRIPGRRACKRARFGRADCGDGTIDGRANVSELAGGLAAWQASGLPMSVGAPLP
jgi:glyoxylase-like metal-dependent hydrolase (beta-lactamase superfamily II)